MQHGQVITDQHKAMKKSFLIAVQLLLVLFVFGQNKYFTRNGRISFQAGTSLEDIDGINNAAASVFDGATGQIEFAVLIKGFEFKKALMQEHFNENYMESDRYPKTTFKGNILDVNKVNFKKDGSYPVTVKGILDMHGIKKEMEASGTLKISGTTVHANAGFALALADYNIVIPGLVKDKISKTVSVKLDCIYNEMK